MDEELGLLYFKCYELIKGHAIEMEGEGMVVGIASAARFKKNQYGSSWKNSALGSER